MSSPPAACNSAPEVVIFQIDKSVSGATHQGGNEEKGRQALDAAWMRQSCATECITNAGSGGGLQVRRWARGSEGGEGWRERIGSSGTRLAGET